MKKIIRPDLEGGATVGGVEVIDSQGRITGNIKDTLAQGSIYIGDSSNVTSELSIKSSGRILVGNGTTATSVAVSNDATLASTGALTVTGVAGATNPIITTVTSTSATTSNVRAMIGGVVDATTITSGILTGVRGIATIASASGGFVYGTQGKLVVTGTLSFSVWAAGLFRQLDMSAATTNAGQVAAIWGDWGATSGTETDMTGARGIAMTNTTDATLNAQIYLYGKATNLFELAGPGSVTTYFLTSGTSAGSAGDTSKCNAPNTLRFTHNGTSYYIPVFAQN